MSTDTPPSQADSLAESEATLASTRQQLAEALQARDRFLATLGHEVRTPLNAIIGMAGLLADTQLTAEQRDFAHTIRVSGDHLLTLFNHVLDYSRLETGRMPIEHVPFAVLDVVEEALEMVALPAREKRLELACELASDVPPQLIGDPGRVRQILVNYLSNAVKFTARGEVAVSVRARPRSDSLSEIEFSVRDTGIGLTAEQRQRLFQAFSQADEGTSRRYGGAGLGLAVSRRLAELMGGRAWVDSEFGLGAEFSFSIMAAINRRPALPGTPLPGQSGQAGQAALAGARIWLVAGNDTQRRILRQLLHEWGARVRDTALASEALQWARAGEGCDVAIADAALAKELGGSLRGPSAPQLLLLSSGIGLSQSAAAADADGGMVLVKPVRRAALFEALAQLRNRAAAADMPGVATAAAPLAQMAQRLPLRILVAEDNPTNVKLIKIVLGGLGYRPDVAGNGLEVLAALRRQPYDVVLMDVRMPELDGIETTRCIHDEWRHGARPRIVALTAGVMPEERKACLDAGVDEFLVKPAVRAQLIEALERCHPVGTGVEAATAAQGGS